MDPKQHGASPFSEVGPRPSSSETHTPLQPSPEPQTPDDWQFSSLFGYTLPTSISTQQVSTSSTTTISLPSTPSTAPSLISSPPNHMQHYTIPVSAMDTQNPLLSPTSPFRALDDKPKKVPRPPNAFMLFRSWLIRDGKLPPEIGKRQQNISRIAGKAWNLLDETSKNGWRREAFRRLHDHEKKHPDYKFEPSTKSRRTGLEKIGKTADDSGSDAARGLKAFSDVFAKDHRAVKVAGSRRPRQRASPYKFPTKEFAPNTPTRGYKTPQLITGSQLGSPTIPSLITFDSPSQSSVQSLSPLSLHAQLHASPQGMPQQSLPHTFLPPGLPNHFGQAYQQENGTIVFADDYAPVNPYAPPTGYYTFDHTGIVPAVDMCEMMTGTASNTTAAMLGLYELNSPYAHYNPNLDAGGSGLPNYQPPVQTSPVLPITNAPPAPLSTAPLTPHEQQVFNAVMGRSRLPLSLEDLISLPLSFSGDGFMTAAGLVAGSPSPDIFSSQSPFSISTLPKELSFTELQTSKTARPASTLSQLPATNRRA